MEWELRRKKIKRFRQCNAHRQCKRYNMYIHTGHACKHVCECVMRMRICALFIFLILDIHSSFFLACKLAEQFMQCANDKFSSYIIKMYNLENARARSHTHTTNGTHSARWHPVCECTISDADIHVVSQDTYELPAQQCSSFFFKSYTHARARDPACRQTQK